MSKSVEITARGRDVRVDRIGYVQELSRLWADPMKDAVKERMADQELELVEGDRYEGKLVPAMSCAVDAARFFALYKKGVISEADFISSIVVSKKAASEFMAPRELEEISIHLPGSPRFTITRKKGIDVPLAEAIAGIVDAASPSPTAAASAEKAAA